MSSRSTLVLALSGPLQSWGDASVYSKRGTHSSPTYSAIIGLLKAALGITVDGRVIGKHCLTEEDLLRLQVWVRVERPGSVLSDLHTIREINAWEYSLSYPGVNISRYVSRIRKPSGKRAEADSGSLSRRLYLTDACFLVLVSGDEHVVDVVAEHLRSPVFTLWLGRKGCVPDWPILRDRLPDGIQEVAVSYVRPSGEVPGRRVFVLTGEVDESDARVRVVSRRRVREVGLGYSGDAGWLTRVELQVVSAGVGV